MTQWNSSTFFWPLVFLHRIQSLYSYNEFFSFSISSVDFPGDSYLFKLFLVRCKVLLEILKDFAKLDFATRFYNFFHSHAFENNFQIPWFLDCCHGFPINYPLSSKLIFILETSICTLQKMLHNYPISFNDPWGTSLTWFSWHQFKLFRKWWHDIKSGRNQAQSVCFFIRWENRFSKKNFLLCKYLWSKSEMSWKHPRAGGICENIAQWKISWRI